MPEPLQSNAVIPVMDDDPSVRKGLERLIRSLGWQAETFAPGQEFLDRWKRRMRLCTAAVCFLQLASALSAAEPGLVKLAVSEGNDIRFSHLTSKDGLSPGQIGDIVQDNQGFLWFNTSQFLNRYDGYHFKSYTRDAAHPNYPAGSLFCIFKDRSGYLWVSSNEDLERFDPVTETSSRFPIDHDGPHSLLGPVRHISQDRAGTVWLASPNGLYRLDAANGAFRHYSHDPSDPASLSSSVVTSTYEDREGTLWVGTLAGLDAFDRRTEKVTERIRLNVSESRSIKAIEDHAGVLWIIYTSANGLASWDRHTRRLTLYSFKDREPPATELSGAERIYEDADDNLWLTTYGSGLVKIDPSRRSAVQYRATRRPNSIDLDSLTALLEDREGTVWVGVPGTGVDKFRRKPLPFQRYVVGPGTPFEPFITIDTSVYVDSQENIWVGSPIGLTRIDNKSGEYSVFRHAGPPPADLSNVFVTSIVEDRSGDLWVGTYGGGLNRYDPRTRRFTAFRHNPADPESLSHDMVYSLMVDHQGTLWAGTEDGLNRCDDPATGRFRSWKAGPAGASPQEVPGMVEDSNGVLWLASGTLQRFDPAKGRFTAYRLNPVGTGRAEQESSSTLVRSATKRVNSYLTIDHSGVIWAATANGLLRFDPKRELFTTYDERDGLPSNSVNAILEDHNGNLWVSTAGGLSRFNPRTKTFTNYYEADGLTSDVFEGSPVAYQTGRGQMFFGNKRGLTSFWPDEIVEKPFIPPVVLTGFSLLNRPVAPVPGSPLTNSITFTRMLTLSHDQNMFSFEFAALSYLDPPRNQYRYMMEGLDHSWIPVDSDRRVATFTTLPAGNYTLRVQGSNNRGVWNEQGVALQLKILPPWWGTWWFRALVAATFLALLGAAYQFRIWQVQQESRRLRDVIETIPAYVWSSLPDGFIDFINRRWLEFSGFSLNQALGWGWADAAHPDDRARLLEAWRAAIASGKAVEAEARMRSADGQYRWLLFRNVPLHDPSGRVVKWYGQSTDITERKQAEEERERLRQLEADLAHINRVSMMGELAASVAHEVNQPLTGIVSNGSACLRFLAGDAPNMEEAREAVRDIVRDGKRAGEVIARIRALTKRTALPREKLDLNETIREVLAIVGDEAKRKSAVIRTQFADDLSPVLGDRVQLQQVLLNLVMNGLEAMSTVDGRERQLQIITRNTDQDRVQVTVEDSGTGLDSNTMARIFEPFFTTKSSGMGMGLSISRSIIQNHGGRLWATPNTGPGTSFHFTLPKYRGEESNAGAAAV
jgi:PAS domain S-box-containing protein